MALWRSPTLASKPSPDISRSTRPILIYLSGPLTQVILVRPTPHAYSDRKLLCQDQAVSCDRHPIREDRAELPRRRPPGRQRRLAQLMTGPKLQAASSI